MNEREKRRRDLISIMARCLEDEEGAGVTIYKMTKLQEKKDHSEKENMIITNIIDRLTVWNFANFLCCDEIANCEKEKLKIAIKELYQHCEEQKEVLST